MLVLALDIGGTKFSAALVTEEGKILARQSRPTNREGGAVWMIKEIGDLSEELLRNARDEQESPSSQLPSKEQIVCGIGFGGPVNFASQSVIKSNHVSGWQGQDLTRIMQERLGLLTVVDNDANAGALGELTYGAARGCKNMIYLTVSTGIGSAIVIDGSLYRGSSGLAGEVGHTLLVADGPLCSCGRRGCLESLCSGLSIARDLNELISSTEGKDSSLCKLWQHGVSLTAKNLFDAAREGDQFACRFVAQICQYLALSIVNLYSLFDPQMIVIGGGISKAGAILLDPLKERIAATILSDFKQSFDCSPALLADDSVLLGAAKLALDRFS